MKILFFILILFGCKEKKEQVLVFNLPQHKIIPQPKNDLFDAIKTLDEQFILETIEKKMKNKSFSVNSTDHEGTNALTQVLISTAESDFDPSIIIKKLLENGADPNFKTSFGFSPLSIAIQNNQINAVKELLSAGADSTEVLSNGRDLFQLAQDLKRNTILNLLQNQ